MGMKNKEKIIRASVQQLLRIANQQARAEKLSIQVDDTGEVTTREIHAIQCVGDRTGITVTEVARFFGISKSAASQTVTRLVKRGFVEKKPAPDSKKEFQLILTRLGRKAYRAHERFHGSDMRHIIDSLSGFSLQQNATLSAMLNAIGSVFERRLGE